MTSQTNIEKAELANSTAQVTEESSKKNTEASAQHNTTAQWQRIHPIGIIYFLAKFIKIFISNFIFALPAIFLSFNKLTENPEIWLPVLLVLVSLLLLSTVLSFYFFQYRLNNDHIEIRSGVISKKHLNLPFTRIQNVKLEQPLYYRWFDYTCLALDTAGSAKQEAKVVALKSDFAEQLKAEILAQHQMDNTKESARASEQTSETKQNANTEQLLNTRSIKDLVIHGLTNNRIWIFLGGLAPFFDDIANHVVTYFKDIGIDIEQLLTFADKPFWQIGLYALTITIAFVLVVSLLSIAGSIITFYNYTLTKLGDRYIRRSGLLTKHEVTMRLSRLQMVVRQQDWLDVLLKRINLKFEQINVAANPDQLSVQNNKIIVPSVFPNECATLINDVYPENNMSTVNYQPISKHFLLRNLGFILTPIFILLASIALFNQQLDFLAGCILGYALLTVLVVMRWYRWGYASDDNFIYIRKGVLGVDYYCFPIYKVQQVQVKQSWFLKRNQLCSLHLLLAAGMQDIPFISENIGLQLADKTLFEVESTSKSWM
ncbi:PH domain-containing protein [Thalassotalea sp. PLHSN55]|uniref:PH domain-containing protein n=1 Tax=Thalassotalea sp. PLHSN55 TaxID=3435888 RepID=UPI003F8440EB